MNIQVGIQGAASGLEQVRRAAEMLDAAAKFAKKSLKQSDKATSPLDQSWYAGLAAYEVREYDVAVEFLSTAYQLSPEARVASQLAMCFWRENDFPNAEMWMKQAISIEPDGFHDALLLNDKVSYLALYAAIQLAQGKVDAAGQSVDASLARKMESLSIRVKSHVLLSQGRGPEALDLLDVGIKELHSGKGGVDDLQFEKRLVSDLIGAGVEVAPFFSVSRVGSWPD